MADVAATPAIHEVSIKVLVWLIPAIFAAGILFQTVASDGGSLESVATSLSDHERLEGHPVMQTEMQHISTQQSELMTEQREMRAEQQQQAIDLVAICRATGANCSR